MEIFNKNGASRLKGLPTDPFFKVFSRINFKIGGLGLVLVLWFYFIPDCFSGVVVF